MREILNSRWQDCTFFTKKEILHIHKRFRQLFSDQDNRNITIDSKASACYAGPP